MSGFSLRLRLAAAAGAAALLGVLVPVVSAAAASADPRPGTITSVTVRANGSWTYTGIYLSHGTVVLSGSGAVFVNGSVYGPAGGGGCTGALVSYLPCNSLIGRIGNGPYFEIPNTDYLHVFRSGHLRLAVNTPTGAYRFGAFHVGVVGLP